MQNEFEAKQQMKMQLDLYKICFNDCVNSLSTSDLSTNEKSCLQNCAKRQMQTFMVLGETQQTLMARQGGQF